MSACPLFRCLQAVIDTVSHEMNERILHPLQNAPINFNLASLKDQLHNLALVPREVADQLWQHIQECCKGQQQKLLHLLEELVHHSAKLSITIRRCPSQRVYLALECREMGVMPLKKLQRLGQLRRDGTMLGRRIGPLEGLLNPAHLWGNLCPCLLPQRKHRLHLP